MKKGCLTSILIFFALCLALSMCSTNSDHTISESSGSTSISVSSGVASDFAISAAANNVAAATDTQTPILIVAPSTESTDHSEDPADEADAAPDTSSQDAAIVEDTVSEPPHAHTFLAATCTDPKTCSCGATEGTATGHNWKSATCSTPKTCTTCGAESGSAISHSYSGGSCDMCGKSDPNYQKEPTGSMVWIPTKGGKKYHSHSGCSNMINPDYVTESRAKSLGFTPCKRCY